jgi:hypothetical protein
MSPAANLRPNGGEIRRPRRPIAKRFNARPGGRAQAGNERSIIGESHDVLGHRIRRENR